MKVQKSATTPYLTSKNTIYKPKNSEICLEPQPRITNADNYTKWLRHNRLASIIIFAQNHLAKGVLTSFSIVSHKSNPWKKGTMKVYWNAPLQPQIMGFISRKNPKMYQNHTAKVVTWLFSMYISYKWVLWGCFCIITNKLPPLENQGRTVWMNNRHKPLKFARKYWGNGLYEFAFPLLHTNHPPGKRGLHSLNELQGKNSQIWMKAPRHWVFLGFYGKVHFPAIATLKAGLYYYFCSEPLGKRGFDAFF